MDVNLNCAIWQYSNILLNQSMLTTKNHSMDLVDRDAFLIENEAWEDLIRRQRADLNILFTSMGQFILNHRLADEERDGRVETFRAALQELEKKMLRLEDGINMQSKYLSDKRHDRHPDFLHRSLKRQERLRDRIRCVERGFFLLKSEWMTWLWSMH
jgi:hypothetical protein